MERTESGVGGGRKEEEEKTKGGADVGSSSRRSVLAKWRTEYIVSFEIASPKGGT